jgi:hypothetical protein
MCLVMNKTNLGTTQTKHLASYNFFSDKKKKEKKQRVLLFCLQEGSIADLTSTQHNFWVATHMISMFS